MEVWREEKILTSSRSHSIHIDAITSKRRHKHLAIDLELRRPARILPDLVADGPALADVPPVKVEGDEDLHAVSGGGFVGEVQLGVGVGVCADVEGKGVYACFFGALHVIVVVGGAIAVTGDSDLVGDDD